jgi:hypothetical protein
MYDRIKGALSLPLRGKILGISGIKNFYRIIDREKAEVLEVEYPEVDMQRLPGRMGKHACPDNDSAEGQL